jgi:dihydroflavonol-4-reductase
MQQAIYLITGCNGLVGSYIARKLLQENHLVKALKRQHSDMSFVADIADKIIWEDGDILDVSSLSKAMEGVTYVIHSAAVVSFLSKDYQRMYKTNVEGTANVVNLCLIHNIKKLIHISSIAALGAAQDTVITEKAVWNKAEVPSMYAQTKFEAEIEVWRGVAEGLTACILNPSVVIGRGDMTKSSNQFFRYALSKPYFSPMGEVSLVDVRDVAEIAYQLLHQNIENERFIVHATKLPYLQFFEKIAMFLGIKPPKQEAKLWQLYVALWLSKIGSWLGFKVTPLSKEIIRNAQRKTKYSNEKVKTMLNFSFRSIDDTLAWACEYYK